MTWVGPGFVDHHTHLLRVAAGEQAPCDLTNPEAIAAYHRRMADRWSTPMDDDDRPPIPTAPHELPAALERGLRHAASLGLVQVTEAGMTSWDYLDALQIARDRAGMLPVRVRLLVASGIADPDKLERTGDVWVDVIGVKFYADGWLGPRTCAVDAPFADRPKERGILFLDADTLAKRVDRFAERGFTIATHAIGDRAIDAVLSAYEKVYGADCAAAAPRVEHAQLLSPALIDRMAELGVVACIQPSFARSDRDSARRALDEERLEFAYRWDLLLAAGVPVITGADHPIEALSPLQGLHDLVTGEVPLPLATALDLMTDATAGTIELNDDPASVELDELTELTVVSSNPNP